MTLFEKLRCLLTFGQGVALPLPKIPNDAQPFPLFNQWFEEAKKSGVLLPEAMSVSSCGADGQPTCRMVLLKEFNDDGFVFYTNYTSRKSQNLEENNKVALLFHWNVLQRQIRIEGTVEKISLEQSAQYFHSRDRGSQVGAWASKQSAKITHEDELQNGEIISILNILTERYLTQNFGAAGRLNPLISNSGKGVLTVCTTGFVLKKKAPANGHNLN